MAFGIGVGRIFTIRAVAVVVGLGGALALTGTATADEFVDKASAAAAATPGTKPAQDVLMPALAKMTEPPVQTGWTRDDLLDLLLAAPGDANWKALEAWADGEPQQAALAALETITTGEDRYIIGFGYGRDAVPAEWAEADLYIGLNEDGLLYSATYPYLRRISWLVGLTMFESARAASGGDGDRALSLCAQTVKLGRILLERVSVREKLAGASIMLIAFERLRDVMYQWESAFDADKLREAAGRIQLLRTREVLLPIANKLAADQIIARTFTEKGSVRGVELAELMSGAKTQDRPLTRLSEAAFWAERAGDQADWFDTTDMVKGVWADWEKRWKLRDIWDPIFDIPSDFRRMDPVKFLAVYFPMNGVEELFEVRKRLMVEAAGTVNAMGSVGFRLKQKTLPPMLSSVAPKFVEKLEADPYGVDRRQLNRTFLAFKYWVPIRDQKFDRREEPHPHAVQVIMIEGGGAMVGAGPGGMSTTVIDLIAPRLLARRLANLPDDVLNRDEMTIDASKLREHLTAQMESFKWTSEELNELTRTFKRVADAKINKENFDGRFDTAWAAATAEQGARLAALGIDLQEVNALVKDVGKSLIGMESVQNAIETVDNDGSISADDAKNLMRGVIDVVSQPNVTDKVMAIARSVQERAKAAIEAAGGEGLPTTVFKALVDDTQFLLYSVGPDGVDGLARSVGRGGSDILIWPPILSLQRGAQKSAD